MQTFTALELEEGETRIRLEKNAPAQIMQAPLAASLPSMPQQEAAVPRYLRRWTIPAWILTPSASSLPLWLAYSTPLPPRSGALCQSGQQSQEGGCLCIIEAMKLMNEITAEQDGEVVDICVHSGDVVEFGQPLLKIF